MAEMAAESDWGERCVCVRRSPGGRYPYCCSQAWGKSQSTGVRNRDVGKRVRTGQSLVSPAPVYRHSKAGVTRQIRANKVYPNDAQQFSLLRTGLGLTEVKVHLCPGCGNSRCRPELKHLNVLLYWQRIPSHRKLGRRWGPRRAFPLMLSTSRDSNPCQNCHCTGLHLQPKAI